MEPVAHFLGYAARSARPASTRAWPTTSPLELHFILFPAISFDPRMYIKLKK